jgi:uncharacterized integral membrane protein
VIKQVILYQSGFVLSAVWIAVLVLQLQSIADKPAIV